MGAAVGRADDVDVAAGAFGVAPFQPRDGDVAGHLAALELLGA